MVMVTAVSQADSTKSAAAAVTVTLGISVSPPSAKVNVGQNQQFTATVSVVSNTAVDWSVNGTAGGDSNVETITRTGFYTAPIAIQDPSAVNVTVTSQADPSRSAMAPCTIQAGGVNVNQAAQNPPVKLGTSGGNNLDTSGNFC